MPSLYYVWDLIGAFFEELPPLVVMICSYAFAGSLIIGFFRWFK